MQTGFQMGMERLLGAYTHPAIASQTRGNVLLGQPEERSDVTEADLLEQIERRDAARYRYERQYWESTPEDGRVCVINAMSHGFISLSFFLGTSSSRCIGGRETESADEGSS